MVQTKNGNDIVRPNALIGYALVLGLLLLLLVRQLQVEWTINPQYRYAWGVPVLVIYLFWQRWQWRPPAEPGAATLLADVTAGLLLAAWFCFRIVQEANPDWRLMSWLLAMTAVALGLWAVTFAGGRRWRKHFLLPIAFLLVAVPWPIRFEQAVVQTLMRGVVRLTTEGMNLLGYAATQRGNLIELTEGTVVINGGCSGIRSLQTTLMVALVAGELYRRTVGRRLLLVAGGLVWAILLNLLRAGTLTWLYAAQGKDAHAAWHDPLGYLTLGLAIAGVWIAGAWRKTRDQRMERPSSSPATADLADTPSPPLPRRSAAIGLRRLTPKITWTIVSWLLLTEVATEAWYRGHESSPRPQTSWSVRFPPSDAGFQPAELSEETRVILRCDEGRTGTWHRADGSDWTMFFLKWQPGRMAAQLAHGHTPDVCLPARGFKMLGGLGLTSVRVGATELPFNTYAFESRGRHYYVFFCLTDPWGALRPAQAETAAQTYRQELSRTRRLTAVWRGERHRGQQVLEIAITGYPTREQAEAALRAALPRLITTASEPS